MSLSPQREGDTTEGNKEKSNTTLTIRQLLKAHSDLPNHNQSCEKKCLLEVLQSLEDKPERRVVREGETIKFD